MPRVANPPTRGPQGRTSNSKQGGSSTPHKNSPMKIPLNDDMGEKAARMQSRQALHDRQMDQIKAAVKTPMPPMRKFNSYDGTSNNSPRTPRGSGGRGRESDVDGLGRAVTPMKRVPILANFEEWMKMATDNKINATNSWNFALIDYFHDMSLLLEGDGVNFQKASCTLDGCVKIYTSRVDSVATETGKLLSGLADSGNKKKRGSGEGGEGDGEEEEEEEGEDGVKRKVRKRQRSHESTLAPSFASLQLKKFELEFAVDPLFKKASADFDEGGAKGLLLNHLAIDAEGRIVFDSSDDAVDTTAEEELKPKDDDREETTEPEEESEATPAPDTENKPEESVEIDIAPLANRFFPDINCLMEQDICPSLKDFDLGDPSGSLDVPFLKAPEDWRQDKELDGEGRDNSGIMLDDDNAVGFDDDDVSLAGFDLGGDTGFGEGGEAWARDAALEPMLKVHRVDDGDAGGDDADSFGADGFDTAENGSYTVSLSHQPNNEHENILSYFDNALQKNWAGPEHWKIRRIKANTDTAATNPVPRQRKEKEPFEVNFEAPLDPALAEMIYTPANSNSAVSLPKTQWKTKGRNLLPDDKHFNSRQLLRLFLKPKARMGSRRVIPGRAANRQQADLSSTHNGDIDEAYWANHKPDADPTAGEDGAAKGAYDADFFADDDGLAFPGGVPMDDDDDNLPFADAREAFSPPVDPNERPSTAAGDSTGQSGLAALLSGAATPGGALMTGGFGTQLVTKGGRRIRPEYVNYARVAKKVDVRRLKEEMWKGMGDRLIAGSSWASSNQAGGGLETLQEEDEEDEGFAVPPTPTPAARMNNNPALNNVTDVDHDAYADAVVAELEGDEDGPKEPKQPRLRFTSVMRGLKNVYPEQKMRDISTSYGFICLLHLANEKGLSLKSADGDWLDGAEEAGLQEVFITKDMEAGEAAGGE